MGGALPGEGRDNGVTGGREFPRSLTGRVRLRSPGTSGSLGLFRRGIPEALRGKFPLPRGMDGKGRK
jgi:hypothetical protein